MLFILNRTKKTAKIAVTKENELGYLSVILTDENGKEEITEKIAVTTNADIIEAFGKRFPNGVANMKKDVNVHDFFIQGSSIGYLYRNFLDRMNATPEDINCDHVGFLGITPVKFHQVPGAYDDRSEIEKKLPKNLIIVISDEAANATVTLEDPRNIADSEIVTVSNDYRFHYIVCRWSNWSKLKYPTALKIVIGHDGNDPICEYYRLGVDESGKHPVNGLIRMDDKEIAEFRKEVSERAKKPANSRPNNGFRNNRNEKKPYNNNRNYNRGGRTGNFNNSGDRRPNGYNQRNNNRSYRKNDR